MPGDSPDSPHRSRTTPDAAPPGPDDPPPRPGSTTHPGTTPVDGGRPTTHHGAVEGRAADGHHGAADDHHGSPLPRPGGRGPAEAAPATSVNSSQHTSALELEPEVEHSLSHFPDAHHGGDIPHPAHQPPDGFPTSEVSPRSPADTQSPADGPTGDQNRSHTARTPSLSGTDVTAVTEGCGQGVAPYGGERAQQPPVAEQQDGAIQPSERRR